MRRSGEDGGETSWREKTPVALQAQKMLPDLYRGILPEGRTFHLLRERQVWNPEF